MSNESKILQLSDKEREKLFLPTDAFTGTMPKFLERVFDQPATTESAKMRMHRAIIRQGVKHLRSGQLERIYGKPVLAYNAFANYHGIEPQIHQVVSGYFGAAAMGGEQDGQVLVLIGPKGAAKSQFVKSLRKILKGTEPVPYLAGSQMRTNPMNIFFMVPRVAELMVKKGEAKTLEEARYIILEQFGFKNNVQLDFTRHDIKALCAGAGVEASFEGLTKISDADTLVSAIAFGMRQRRAARNNFGYPDPVVQAMLLGQFGYERVNIWDFPVESFKYLDDQEGSVGISSVKEVEPLKFDMTKFIGEENISALGNVDRADPASVVLNGAYNQANRGLLEVVEAFKNPKEAHRSALEATQDKSIPAPDPMRNNLHWDGIPIYHSNAPEFRDFKADPKNEPYLDRFVWVKWKYPLEASEQEKVERKQWARTDYALPKEEGGVHLEPTIEPYISRFTVLTRMEPSESVPDMMVKLDAYNGDESRLRGMTTKIDVLALKREATNWEGMDGVSPRFTAKVRDELAAEAHASGRRSVTSRELRDRMYELTRDIEDDKQRELYRGFISKELDAWRRKRLSRIVVSAMVPSFPNECQGNFDKYIQNVIAFNRGSTVRSGSSSAWRSGPDEDYMRRIEADPELNITSAQSREFRAEVASVVSAYMQDNQTTKVPYNCYEPLQHAIERFVCEKVAETARVLFSGSARTEEDHENLSKIKKELIEVHGFDEYTADELLREAEETKDFLKEI
jgi:predicted Ser/Thr protein kinase